MKRNDAYICECNAGYNGNGSRCEVNPRQSGNFLVASDGASVYRVPFQVTPRDFATPFNSGVSQIAVGVDIDCEVGRIYWGDVVSYAIKTAAYDGSDYGLFLSEGTLYFTINIFHALESFPMCENTFVLLFLDFILHLQNKLD